MTRIPRTYVAQDNLDTAEHFDFATSTDPVVVDARQAQRGEGVNIIGDQTAGIEVGRRTLDRLHGDPELSKLWAQLFGGAMLISAMYMLRGDSRQPMSRRFILPTLVDGDGRVLDGRRRRTITLASLAGVHTDSGIFEATSAIKRDPGVLGHNLGRTSMLLSVHGHDFKHPDSEFAIMSEARDEARTMHDEVQALATSLRINPSLAQLRSDVTPLGGHIVRSRALGLDLKRAFRESVAEVNDGQGY